ncbi:MAG: TonB-dependent receptor [Gemmatimonadetes bacterium]|nr:TonB-dependent receptor [Gemmatimonadota bacterium]
MKSHKSVVRRVRGWLAAFLVLVGTGAFASVASAQQAGRIVGQVTETGSGAPLGEVQIYLEGTGIGSLTNQSGRFVLLNVPPGTHQLRAERIGMAPASRQVTVAAGQASEANFQLETQALGLDEIVVTGTAGAARRREIGNTVAQINVADLPVRHTEVSQMLQAAAPGVEVTGGGGSVGQGSKIRLRGSKSVEMGSDPIIYVDGVRLMTGGFEVRAAKDQGNRAANVTQSPLDLINPNDIERIEVIKGSAATTLYGTEASAGVIQIFTKRGSQGAPVWSVEMQQGTAWNQRFGVDTDPDPGSVGTPKYLYMDPWICTGFLKCGEFTHTTHTQQYSASVRGGGQNLQYFSSADLLDDLGHKPNDALTCWTARGNFTYTPVTALQLQWNTAYTNQSQSNTASGNNAEGLELNVFRQRQNYFANRDTALINQVLGQTLDSEIERFTTGGTATYSPLTNLTNRFTVGYDFSSQETRNIRGFGFFAHPEGIVHNATFQKRILTFDYVGSYSFDLMTNLRSSFSWGGQAVGDEERLVEGYGRGFPGAAEPTVNSAALTTGYEERQKVWNAGFFLQDVLDISNKYFVTLGMRVDGNSAFGTGFGLQFYPKASLSYVISDEAFWPQMLGSMKLRAAYGQSGRAPGAFDAVRTWDNTALAGDAAFTPENVGNPDLGPEVTGEFEAGFDGAWLDDRVRATFTYYRQLTKDALLDVEQMPSLGFTQAQLLNVGEIENKGMEISVDVSPIRRANWGWDVGVSVTTNESEVLSHVLPDRVGRSIQYTLQTLIRNPDAIPKTTGVIALCTAANVQPTDPCRENNVYRGPDLPTNISNAYTTVRLPYGISLSARGEYRGGMYTSGGVNPISIGRSVRSPLCYPYYANQENVQLKPDTPALWQARCTPSLATGYSAKGDYFKLRSVSATIPVDFAFPDRIQTATLTLTLGNAYTWSRELMFGTFGIENFGNSGIVGTATNPEGGSIGLSGNERTPESTTLRASLRVTF